MLAFLRIIRRRERKRGGLEREGGREGEGGESEMEMETVTERETERETKRQTERQRGGLSKVRKLANSFFHFVFYSIASTKETQRLASPIPTGLNYTYILYIWEPNIY